MPRPRKSTISPAPAEPPAPQEIAAPSADGTAAVVRRRRRRRTVAAPDYALETVKLVEAVLRSRGAKGATQETLQSVITWARGIRDEGEQLRELASRPRRQKTQAPMERLAAYEMNRALLDGILAGAIVLDVQSDGVLVFLHSDSLAAHLATDLVVAMAEEFAIVE
jgi:hypothetical protein